MIVDHARPAREVAVLRDVRDRVAHVLEAALVDQVDDQLQLVEALVVGDLGLVARLDERLEPGLDQRGGAAAEDGLLAEEVALGLLGERRLEQADAPAADRGAVGDGEVERVTACVLVHGDESRGAGAGLVELAHTVAGRLRRDHHDVVPRGGDDAAEVDVEAVREEERSAWLEIRLDLGLVDALLHVVGEQDGDDLRAACRLADVGDGEPGLLRRLPRGASGTEADLDLDAGVAQVERVRVALAAVADHSDLACEQLEVSFAVDRGHWLRLLSAQHELAPTLSGGGGGAAEADAPGADELLDAVRTDELLEGVDLLR